MSPARIYTTSGVRARNPLSWPPRAAYETESEQGCGFLQRLQSSMQLHPARFEPPQIRFLRLTCSRGDRAQSQGSHRLFEKGLNDDFVVRTLTHVLSPGGRPQAF